MKRISNLGTLFVVLGLAIIAVAGIMAADAKSNPVSGDLLTGRAGPVAVRADLSQDKYLLGGDGHFSLRLTLSADQLEDADQERPVDLVLVLDRSGSMDGDKIADAKQAMLGLLELLGPDDRLALVSYASGVTVHGPLTKAGDQSDEGSGLAALASQIRQVEAGGNTNLGAGLSEGLKLLNDSGGARTGRLVLLSDGLANEGVTDPGQLAALASRAMEQGLSLSTVGIGLDFNERLMTSLADAGGGDYTFLEDPAWFAEAFTRELHSARQLAASSMEVRVPLPEGVTLEYAAGYPVEMKGGVAVFRPGGILAGHERELFLTFAAPAHEETAFDLSGVSLAGYSGEDRFQAELKGRLNVACTADETAASDSIHKEVWEAQTLRQDYNRLKDEVAMDVQNGDLDQALARIDDYKAKKQAANQAVGSAKVAENLDDEVVQLEEHVEAALAPSATMQQQKAYSKQLQSESYNELRAKNK